MTLLTPWTGFFLLVGVVPPLLLLYFLKLRRRTMPVSSTLLWLTSTADLQANSPFQRLRRNLLLLLQLIVLLLLVLAIMQPQLEGRRGAGGRTVLLIDRSGSMTATDGGGESRLDQALTLARAAIDRLHPRGLFSNGDGETMIVAFGESAEILQPFSDSRAQLLTALDRIEPSHGRSRLGDALRLARVYSINTDPDNPDTPEVIPAELELFSDGRIDDLDDQVLRGETLTFHKIGTASPVNFAVLQLAADRPWDEPSAIEVFASLGNFTLQPATVDVQLTVDGAARSVQEVEIPAGEMLDGQVVVGRRSLVFSPFELARGAVIEVAILGEDALAADDTAVLVVPPPRRLRVALVADNRQLLARLLGGVSLEVLELFTSAQWEDRDTAIPWDLVIFDGTTPATMVDAPTLTIGSLPPTELLTVYGTQEEGQVALQAKADHPVMRHVDIDRLFVNETKSIQPDESVTVLLEGSRTPLIMAWQDEGQPRVHVAFDLVQSTWPYDPSFVAFLVNAVDWLGHSREALVQEQAVPGGSLVFEVDGGDLETVLTRPDGSVRTLASSVDGRVSWAPVDLSGLHVLEYDGLDGEQRVRRRSVRFPALEESSLQPREAIVLGKETVEATTTGVTGSVPIWPWAIAAALVMLMLEWWIWSTRAGGQRPAGIMLQPDAT
ncbi:MAG: VWA domain-containing protein [Phycisphaerales bacterium]|nr:VWA domain-containing protein [Phycisphaerales bacterium]